MLERELHDDKIENYILKQIFRDEMFLSQLEDIYDIIFQSKDVSLKQFGNFFASLYKKLGFSQISHIGDSQKNILFELFFATPINSKSQLRELFVGYSRDVAKSRRREFYQKGSVFVLIEKIIEKVFNVDDKNFDFFIQQTQYQQSFVYVGLQLMDHAMQQIKSWIYEQLEKYHNISDKYFSFDENFLSHQEIEFFKKQYDEFLSQLYVGITTNIEMQDTIDKIHTMIESQVEVEE